jgi:hypothetical protein
MQRQRKKMAGSQTQTKKTKNNTITKEEIKNFANLKEE